MRNTTLGVALLAVMCAGASATAQDAGRAEDPRTVVRRALGAASPRVLRVARAARAAEVTVPLSTEQGRCYELVGYAAGEARVSAQVILRTATQGDELTLSGSSGRAERARFCATLPGSLYAVRVRAEGPSQWALAVVDAAASAEDAGPAPVMELTREADADAGEGASGLPTYPVGGEARDYVGNRLRAFTEGRTRLVGLGPAVRVTLGTNQSHTLSLPLGSGRCVELVAVGVPSVRDFVLELFDPTGNRVAQDDTHRGEESVRYCAPYQGTWRGEVRVFSGAGLVAIQPLTGR